MECTSNVESCCLVGMRVDRVTVGCNAWSCSSGKESPRSRNKQIQEAKHSEEGCMSISPPHIPTKFHHFLFNSFADIARSDRQAHGPMPVKRIPC